MLTQFTDTYTALGVDELIICWGTKIWCIRIVDQTHFVLSHCYDFMIVFITSWCPTDGCLSFVIQRRLLYEFVVSSICQKRWDVVMNKWIVLYTSCKIIYVLSHGDIVILIYSKYIVRYFMHAVLYLHIILKISTKARNCILKSKLNLPKLTWVNSPGVIEMGLAKLTWKFPKEGVETTSVEGPSTVLGYLWWFKLLKESPSSHPCQLYSEWEEPEGSTRDQFQKQIMDTQIKPCKNNFGSNNGIKLQCCTCHMGNCNLIFHYQGSPLRPWPQKIP